MAGGALREIRTDVVGSLLRPQRWQEARQRLDDGKLAPDAFAEIESACVRDLIDLQERIGLDVVTDGEVSRLNFQDSFGLGGCGLRRHARHLAAARAALHRPNADAAL